MSQQELNFDTERHSLMFNFQLYSLFFFIFHFLKFNTKKVLWLWLLIYMVILIGSRVCEVFAVNCDYVLCVFNRIM